MKFSSLGKGRRARKPYALPMPDGTTVPLDLIPLLSAQDAEVAKGAREYALSQGGKPEDGDPHYEIGIRVHTILLAAIDPDSPLDKPAPFFDGGVAQILDPEVGLDRDRIALLFEAQHAVQDEFSPRRGKMSYVEYIQSVLDHAQLDEKDDLPFEQWRPYMRKSFLLSTCRALTAFLRAKSIGGPGTPADSTTSESSPQPTTESPGPSDHGAPPAVQTP